MRQPPPCWSRAFWRSRQSRGCATTPGSLLRSGQKDAARTGGFGQELAALRGLARRFPGVEPIGRASVAFVQNGVFTMVKASQTDQALAALDEARDVLGTGADAQRTGVGVYDNAAQRRLKAGAFGDAAELYARALGRYPGNSVLLNTVRYLAQEWQKVTYDAGGVPAFAGTVAALRAKFPAMPELSAAASAAATDQV